MEKLVETKQDVKANLEAITPFITMLEALAYGAPVEWNGYKLEMQNGLVFIRARRIDAKNKVEEPHYLGVLNDWPYKELLELCSKEAFLNPKWLEDLRFEKASRATLSNL